MFLYIGIFNLIGGCYFIVFFCYNSEMLCLFNVIENVLFGFLIVFKNVWLICEEFIYEIIKFLVYEYNIIWIIYLLYWFLDYYSRLRFMYELFWMFVKNIG